MERQSLSTRDAAKPRRLVGHSHRRTSGSKAEPIVANNNLRQNLASQSKGLDKPAFQQGISTLHVEISSRLTLLTLPRHSFVFECVSQSSHSTKGSLCKLLNCFFWVRPGHCQSLISFAATARPGFSFWRIRFIVSGFAFRQRLSAEWRWSAQVAVLSGLFTYSFQRWGRYLAFLLLI